MVWYNIIRKDKEIPFMGSETKITINRTGSTLLV